MVIVMFSVPVTISEIFANQIKCKNLTLKMKIHGKEEKNKNCTIRLEMFHSTLMIFSEFGLPGNMFIKKIAHTYTQHTRTHTHTHIHKHTHLHAPTHTHLPTYTLKHTHTHLHIHTHTHTHIYIYICNYIILYIYIHIYIYIYIYICIRTHTHRTQQETVVPTIGFVQSRFVYKRIKFKFILKFH